MSVSFRGGGAGRRCLPSGNRRLSVFSPTGDRTRLRNVLFSWSKGWASLRSSGDVRSRRRGSEDGSGPGEGIDRCQTGTGTWTGQERRVGSPGSRPARAGESSTSGKTGFRKLDHESLNHVDSGRPDQERPDRESSRSQWADAAAHSLALSTCRFTCPPPHTSRAQGRRI